MKFDVTAGAYPVLRVRLAPGEALEAEVRSFVALTGQAEIKSIALKPTRRNVKAAVGGGKRMVTNRFTALSDTTLLLTSAVAGEIVAVTCDEEASFRARPGAYLASEAGVTLDVEIVKLARTSWLPLLSFRGSGALFLGASGAAHRTRLAEGQTMTLDRVHLLACDGTLGIEDVSEKGLWPTLTGQDLIQLTGPGWVYLQTLPRSPRGSPLAEAVKAVTGLL